MQAFRPSRAATLRLQVTWMHLKNDILQFQGEKGQGQRIKTSPKARRISKPQLSHLSRGSDTMKAAKQCWLILILHQVPFACLVKSSSALTNVCWNSLSHIAGSMNLRWFLNASNG